MINSSTIDPLLDVRDLMASFRSEEGVVRAVGGVSFTVARGEVLGIVGESGSGKTVTAQTIIGLNRTDPNAHFSGEVWYKGRNLLTLGEKEMRHVRGEEIAMIFQDPMTSLNPVHRIGTQIREMLHEHTALSKREIRNRSVDLLRQVGIPHPEDRIDDYPHQFSGGMRQRAMIAMAVSCNPSLLIADEPTTALDVTIQAQILELIQQMKNQYHSAVIIITHDLGVIAEIADKVLVMYAGRIVEAGEKRQLFYDPQHPYTWGLLGSIPSLDRPRLKRLSSIPGAPPSLIDLPQGCKFRPRCAYAFDRCVSEPELADRGMLPGHLDRCWLSLDQKRALRHAATEGEVMPA
jgi:peptide/nickel transport system ATP-binding protein